MQENKNRPDVSSLPKQTDGRSAGDNENNTANFEFSNLNTTSIEKSNGDMDFILDIPLKISVELGRTEMEISDLLKLGQGSVIELSKLAGESLEIMANRRLIAKGEVVVVNEKYGVRLTEIISPAERIERLK